LVKLVFLCCCFDSALSIAQNAAAGYADTSLPPSVSLTLSPDFHDGRAEYLTVLVVPSAMRTCTW
jgi:hypothetical protein